MPHILGIRLFVGSRFVAILFPMPSCDDRQRNYHLIVNNFINDAASSCIFFN